MGMIFYRKNIFHPLKELHMRYCIKGGGPTEMPRVNGFFPGMIGRVAFHFVFLFQQGRLNEIGPVFLSDNLTFYSIFPQK